MLCRKRSQFDPVVEALEDAGIPYEVVGLGGLLHTPEIADIVALLHVVQDPTRGDRLMRLLTGPSCRLGAADLDGLAEWSRLRQRPGRGDRNADLSPDASERASIVEALDDLPPATWVGAEGQRLSAAALQRLEGLGAAVRRLRGAHRAGPARAGRGGRDLARPRHRGALAPRLLARCGARPPRRVRRRRRDLRRQRRPPHPRAASWPGSRPPSTRSAGSTSAGSRPGPTPCRS